MRVAIYARVSTLRQQQSQTIEQQFERLQAHIAEQGWELAEEHIFRDDGYSGAKLTRPGLERLRERAVLGEFELVLITAPDRLARNYVHQVLLLEELTAVGCQVEFLDRPVSDDPHDQLVLQIRGAVAEYERSLIADRMRRGRQAKLKAGLLLPWTTALYGYILDAEQPRDPSRVRVNEVEAAIVGQIFGWYTDPEERSSLYTLAKQLSDDGIPTPTGQPRWNVATIRGMLKNPAYTGTAYANRTHPVPARHRKSALLPVGPGQSQRPTPKEEWIPIPVPAIITQEQFDQAQDRLALNKQMARRNNTQHDYLLRGLVSCGQCRLACLGRTRRPGYSYYVCRGKTDALRAATGERCQARYAPAQALDALVWQDLVELLSHPEQIIRALQRAQSGEWLPQQLQARRQTLNQALAQLARQEERLLEAYLAEVLELDELERKRQDIAQKQQALQRQVRQLELQIHKQIEIDRIAPSIEAFCHRVQRGLEQATFAQKRELVELLIDRVIVDDAQVEIRYVIPTTEASTHTRFCHLRKDYFNVPADGQDVNDRLGICIYQGASPVAGPLQGSVRAGPGDQYQSRSQFAHPGTYCVDVYGVTALLRGPDCFIPVLCLQGSCILGQAEPLTAAILGDDTHLAVALQPAAEVPTPFPGRLAYPLAVVPTVDQDVGVCTRYRLELLKFLHGHIHLALEGHSFPLTDGLLSVQTGQQRTATPQQDVQSHEKTVPAYHPLLSARVMPPQAAHLPPLGFGMHRIVKDQVTCHHSRPRTSPTLRPLSPLTDVFGLDQRLHLPPETDQPDSRYLSRRPWPAAQKTREPRQADLLPNTPQQLLERASSFTFHQPQQYRHKVLPLALAETSIEALKKLAQHVGKTYNRFGHGLPLGYWRVGAYHYPQVWPCPLFSYS
jgi:site-specific DNA recombinase